MIIKNMKCKFMKIVSNILGEFSFHLYPSVLISSLSVLYFIYCIVLVLYCIVLYCIVLYCIVLYCIVLYCVVLYYCILFNSPSTFFYYTVFILFILFILFCLYCRGFLFYFLLMYRGQNKLIIY